MVISLLPQLRGTGETKNAGLIGPKENQKAEVLRGRGVREEWEKRGEGRKGEDEDRERGSN